MGKLIEYILLSLGISSNKEISYETKWDRLRREREAASGQRAPASSASGSPSADTPADSPGQIPRSAPPAPPR